MNFKALIKSKAFWTGVAAIVTGVGLLIQGDQTTGVQTIFGGLATIFIRDAIANK